MTRLFVSIVVPPFAARTMAKSRDGGDPQFYVASSNGARGRPLCRFGREIRINGFLEAAEVINFAEAHFLEGLPRERGTPT